MRQSRAVGGGNESARVAAAKAIALVSAAKTSDGEVAWEHSESLIRRWHERSAENRHRLVAQEASQWLGDSAEHRRECIPSPPMDGRVDAHALDLAGWGVTFAWGRSSRRPCSWSYGAARRSSGNSGAETCSRVPDRCTSVSGAASLSSAVSSSCGGKVAPCCLLPHGTFPPCPRPSLQIAS